MSWFNRKHELFPPEERARIVSAIIAAEKMTSGEIRVHIQDWIFPCVNLERRVKKLFNRMGMGQTKDRNGILFFICPRKHQFVILGDIGIHEKVSQAFWDKLRDLLQTRFKEDRVQDGLIEVIARCGEELKQHFPYHASDQNELSDHISGFI